MRIDQEKSAILWPNIRNCSKRVTHWWLFPSSLRQLLLQTDTLLFRPLSISRAPAPTSTMSSKVKVERTLKNYLLKKKSFGRRECGREGGINVPLSLPGSPEGLHKSPVTHSGTPVSPSHSRALSPTSSHTLVLQTSHRFFPGPQTGKAKYRLPPLRKYL